MERTRDEAEALAEALSYGLCEVGEVVAWADEQLLRADRPAGALCDLAMAAEEHPLEVASLLRRLPGTPNEASVTRRALELLSRKLEEDRGNADRVASVLYEMALGEKIDDPNLDAGWFDDALRLADLGYFDETREDVIDQMTRQLREAVAPSLTTRPGRSSEGVSHLDSPEATH